MTHTDAGALLKLAADLVSNAATYEADSPTRKLLHKAADKLRQAASQGSAGGEAGRVASEIQKLIDVIEAVRGKRGLLRVSGTRGDPDDVGVLGIERFNDLMMRAIDALALPKLTAAGKRTPFYGAECPSYPNCYGGCGLGCTHEIERARGAAQAVQEPLRYCEYCSSWNRKPCGEGCVWTPNLPTVEEAKQKIITNSKRTPSVPSADREGK